MTQVTHTIQTDDEFVTAGDAAVSIKYVNTDNSMDVTLIPFDGSNTEHYCWNEETVVEFLVNGNLMPKDGDAIDFLSA